MAKYIDSNGLSHLMTLIKGAFSVKTHTHSLPTTTSKGVDTFSQGTLPTLGTAFTIPNISKKTVVTSVTKKTVVTGGTKTGIPNVTDVGSTPTLGTAFTIPNISVSTKSIPNVTSAGTAASASVSGHKVTFTNGTAPTLGTAISVGSASAGTAFTVPNITSVGSAPTLGTEIEAYTALTTGDSVTVGTGDSVTVGTAFAVPNVTGVGTLPSLSTENIITLTGSTTGQASA